MTARRWAEGLPVPEARVLLELLAEAVPFRHCEDLLDRLRGVPDRPGIGREDFEGAFNELEDERLIRWQPESGRYAVVDPGRVAELREALAAVAAARASGQRLS